MILDSGVLIAIDRGDPQARSLVVALRRRSTPMRTTQPVVAQVWRSGRQAVLAQFLKALVAVHPLDDGLSVGAIEDLGAGCRTAALPQHGSLG